MHHQDTNKSHRIHALKNGYPDHMTTHWYAGIFSCYWGKYEELQLLGRKMATSVGINNPCKCLTLSVNHLLKSANDLSLDYERLDTFPDFP